MKFPTEIETVAKQALETARLHQMKMITAESCTAGLITGALSAIAGSSDVLEGGFVTYANEAKIGFLGVDPACLQKHGAVSEDVAAQMARGALLNSRGDISVAVTGIAGPGGGSPDKPVGLVYIACALKEGETQVERHLFSGGREQVREKTVLRALQLMTEVMMKSRSS